MQGEREGEKEGVRCKVSGVRGGMRDTEHGTRGATRRKSVGSAGWQHAIIRRREKVYGKGIR